MFINNVFSNTKDSTVSKFCLYLDSTNVKSFYQYQRMFCNARNVSYISGELLNTNLARGLWGSVIVSEFPGKYTWAGVMKIYWSGID